MRPVPRNVRSDGDQERRVHRDDRDVPAMTAAFQAWPKTPRLFRDIVVSEKIDGTNAAVIVTDDWEIAAQSRSRLITPVDDNFGFARWVYDNEDGLKDLLGPGTHFGE